MPYNGSGTFTPVPPPTFPAVTGTLISAAAFNTMLLDMINNGLSLALVRDGQGAMTGPLNAGGFKVLNVAAPAASGDAVNKTYADQFLPKTGGVLTGNLDFGGFKGINSGAPSAAGDLVNKAYADTFLLKAGGTMTGEILGLPAPTTGGSAVNKTYADTFLPKAGGTMTGALIGLAITGLAITGTVLSDSKGDVRTIVVNAQGAGYTLVAADAGKTVTITGGLTIPAGIFTAGQAITIYNGTAGNVTLTQGGGLTLRFAGTALTGNRTLSQRGLATLLFISGSEAIISGSVLS